VIFAESYREPDLRGFGVVLREEEEIYEDEIMLISVNYTSETEAYSDNIFKIAENRTCIHCGGVVCIDHMSEDIPYYCPSCEEGMFEFETEEVHINQFAEALANTKRRFLPNLDN
jgi:hypothetical protein